MSEIEKLHAAIAHYHAIGSWKMVEILEEMIRARLS